MKYSVQIKNVSFSISKTVSKLLESHCCDIQKKTEGNSTVSTVFTLVSSLPSFFQVLKASSSTHFFILVFGKKYRISKALYDYLSYLPNKEEIKRSGQLQKKLFEKFYTKLEVAQLCVSYFASNIKVQSQDLIVEPSAGNGSFVKSLEAFNCGKVFMDIEPENSLVKRADFLG